MNDPTTRKERSVVNNSTRPRAPANGLPPAHALASLGMPIVCGRLNDAGDPDTSDRRWSRWQRQTPGERSLRAADSWKDGEALAGVTGVVYDVLDVDPRNGGTESLRWMSDELGEDGPEVYWTIRTPRGGSHLYIAPLGVGSHNGWKPGLDLKGGNPDGTGRGFVFLPPTERYGKRYRVLEDGSGPNGDGPCLALAELVEKSVAEKEKNSGGGKGGDRATRHAAKGEAASTALPGGQQQSLRDYAHSLAKSWLSEDEALTLLRKAAKGLTLEGRRWTDADLLGLFRSSRKKVVAEPRPGSREAAELDGLSGGHRLVQPFSEVELRRTEWIITDYLARGEMTLLDGEKGSYKSFLCIDWSARLSQGDTVDWEERTGEALNIIIFTAESKADTETGLRLKAAGADMDRVFRHVIPKNRRGKVDEGWILPEGAARFGEAIREVNADVAFFDPINDFFSETVNPYLDASVRRALAPLGQILQEADCAGLLIRHMGKDTTRQAKHRGLGATAYQNRCRVHLVASRLPDEFGGPDMCGLAIVDNNLRKVEQGIVTYKVVDTNIVSDNAGGFVGKLEWHGRLNINADRMTQRPQHERGRSMAQEEIGEVLEQLFSDTDTLPSERCMEELKAAECSTHKQTLGKAKEALGIRSVQRKKGTPFWEEKGAGWNWTTRPIKRRAGG